MTLTAPLAVADLPPAATDPATLATIQLPLTLTALAPIHHGAGTAGNTALLRTQEVILPDGTQTAVPYVSGNSFRHAIRDALAWRMVRTLAVPTGGLSKAQVDLLWSGGALTRPGAQIDLGLSRALGLVPALATLGYSVQSDIVAGPLRVDLLNLVCRENGWRLPAYLIGHPHAEVPAGRFRGEEFGTRHDITGSAPSLLVDTGMVDVAPTTTQMIYEHQVLLPGAVLWGHLQLDAACPLARDALHTALHDLALGGRMWVAARRASGWGSCHLTLHEGAALDVDAVARHDEHLLAHRDQIMAALTDGTV